MKSHIFVRHPDRKKLTCWSCDARKEDHQYTVQQSTVQILIPKSRKKGNARSARTKGAGIPAVR